MTVMLAMRDVVVEYQAGGELVRPVDGLDVDADSGDLVLLLGPSGCGKTTLLSCIAGILRPTAGTVVVAGTDVTALSKDEMTEYRRRSVGIVFQAFNLLPSLTARDNVALPLRAAGVKRATALLRADDLLDQVGMAERRGHRPDQLSGGQQQRVAIARALALDPPVIVADEPTAHLDAVQVEVVLRLLRDLARPGRMVVVSTHDHRLEPLADRTVDLGPQTQAVQEQGRIVELTAGDILFHQGDDSDVVYEVEQGEIVLYRTEPDGSEVIVRRARAGDYFGELGPILGQPRSTSARARHRTRLLAQDPVTFRRRRRFASTPPATEPSDDPAPV